MEILVEKNFHQISVMLSTSKIDHDFRTLSPASTPETDANPKPAPLPSSFTKHQLCFPPLTRTQVAK